MSVGTSVFRTYPLLRPKGLIQPDDDYEGEGLKGKRRRNYPIMKANIIGTSKAAAQKRRKNLVNLLKEIGVIIKSLWEYKIVIYCEKIARETDAGD